LSFASKPAEDPIYVLKPGTPVSAAEQTRAAAMQFFEAGSSRPIAPKLGEPSREW
jgi:hypothetical protein